MIDFKRTAPAWFCGCAVAVVASVLQSPWLIRLNTTVKGKPMIRVFTWLIMSAACAMMAGCVRESSREVVVYAALDKEFSEPILKQFEQETGIRVLAKYDVESNKTVGLANEIIDSAKRPKGDVFWNNEILHSLRMEKLGLLQIYRSPLADQFPAQFVSPTGAWHGFAARARVLLVNTNLLPDKTDWPTSIRDLADPKWAGKCGLAKPLFGTTATHAAVLFSVWPESESQQFFEQVKTNAMIEGGNKQVALNVAAGRYAFGLTDTDDAIIELEHGQPVAIVFPDQAENQSGTLLIPNTLCVIKNGPHTDSAKRLVDYLLQTRVEEQLAAGASAQIPLGIGRARQSRVAPENLKIMTVDFPKAAEQWTNAQTFLIKLFQ